MCAITAPAEVVAAFDALDAAVATIADLRDRLSDPVPVTMPALFPYGEIYGMNADGVMVGIMWDDEGVEHAFVFDTDRGVQDLNDLIDPSLGWVLNFAQ